MLPIIIDLTIALILIISAWRGFVQVFWCEMCDSPSISGNVTVNGKLMCRTHAREATTKK